MSTAKATFPSLREIQPDFITFSAVLVDYPDRGRVEISPEAWPLASVGVDTFEIGIVGDGFDSGPRLPETPLRSVMPEAPAAASPPKAADPEGYDELSNIFCHRAHFSLPRSSSSRVGMTLFVKPLFGAAMTVTDLHPADTISRVKEKIKDMNGVLLNGQRLIINGQDLEDTQTLSSYGIQDQTTIQFRHLRRL